MCARRKRRRAPAPKIAADGGMNAALRAPVVRRGRNESEWKDSSEAMLDGVMPSISVFITISCLVLYSSCGRVPSLINSRGLELSCISTAPRCSAI
jgi:hypothetical protein